MPELTTKKLAGLFAWVVDAQEFVPLTDAAKQALDQLIAYQQQQQNQKQQVPEKPRVFRYRLTLPDKNVVV